MDRGEDVRDKEDDKEYSGEEGRGKADRTAARTAMTRQRTTIANRRAGTTQRRAKETRAEERRAKETRRLELEEPMRGGEPRSGPDGRTRD